MSDLPIRDTLLCLDRALARIALTVSGSRSEAEVLMASLGRGEATAATRAFLAEAAALLRARLLLTAAASACSPRSLRKVA